MGRTFQQISIKRSMIETSDIELLQLKNVIQINLRLSILPLYFYLSQISSFSIFLSFRLIDHSLQNKSHFLFRFYFIRQSNICNKVYIGL
jgi:hypothetical protein